MPESNQNKHIFPEWMRYSVSTPSIVFGTLMLISSFIKNNGDQGITTLIDAYHINAEIVNDIAKDIDAHSENQNALFGSFFVAFGASVICAKQKPNHKGHNNIL